MPLPSLPTCPTCGGLIGATTATSAGYPCTCFDSSADTVDEPADLLLSPASPAKAKSPSGTVKRCHKCGKDISGHRRFKDSLGYWCKDCHRLDKAQNTVAEARCPDCGRMRPLDKLYMHDDHQICASCLKVRKSEADRAAHRAIAEQAHKSHERRGLYILLIVAGLLVLIVLFQHMRH